MSPDNARLKTLSTLHYLFAFFVAFAGTLPIFHVAFGVLLVTGMVRPSSGPINMEAQAAIGWTFITSGVVFVAAAWLIAAVLTSVGGRLRRARSYGMCFAVACVECVMFPIGTALGAFTLVVLSRSEIRGLFDRPSEEAKKSDVAHEATTPAIESNEETPATDSQESDEPRLQTAAASSDD